jgi:hypothetical protein
MEHSRGATALVSSTLWVPRRAGLLANLSPPEDNEQIASALPLSSHHNAMMHAKRIQKG